VHRIGQTKKVTVTRLIINDTVETRVQELQMKKGQLLNSALSFGQVTKEDLVKLM
jgi:SNF2 family DNA or RNA helicase